MPAFLRILATLGAAVLIASCGPPFVATEGLTYVVQPGDTLYAIAWRLDLDYRDVARWNHLGTNYRLAVGQVLKVSPDAASAAGAPSARPAVRKPAPADSAGPPVRWDWPATGEILGPVPQPTGGFGLRVLGRLGDPVRAAAAGRVVYSGTALKNYGHLIIVKHDNRWLSAYGHNDAVLVTEGQQVAKGQAIAQMGMGPGQRPALYFEIRLDGKSVDPLRYLPHRGP
ncbi:MAG TPA: peptidoglycan DD-metalloendopeptidase family protein [Steroidobacteraceae bacterium]|nr:peptidoglycan DD-metalloendopeptidase family protein [Steroidobacteraceae bacterium]